MMTQSYKSGCEPELWFLLPSIAYGVILTTLGFFAAGAGHGTYLLLALSSSPLPLISNGLGIIGGPIFWGVVGLTFAFRNRPIARRLFVGLMATHYIGLWPVLVAGGSEWSYLVKVWTYMPLVLICGAIVYAGGQVMLWISFLCFLADAHKRSQRPLQISIRRMLLVVLLIAVALACLRAGAVSVQGAGVIAAAVASVVVFDPAI